MADEALQCKFCWETFKQPVLLECGHSICLPCARLQLAFRAVDKTAVHSKSKGGAPVGPPQQPESFVICPYDNVRTAVGVGGAESMKPNRDLAEVVQRHHEAISAPATCGNCAAVAVATCATCGDFCDSCLKAVHGFAIFKTHVVGPVGTIRKAKADQCAKHNRELDLYCTVDSQIVCMLCERSPDHKGHECIVLSDFADTCRKGITQQANDLKARATAARDAVVVINSVIAAVKENDEKFAGALKSAMAELHATLQKREETLLAESTAIARTKGEKLHRQAEALMQIADCLEQDASKLTRHAASGSFAEVVYAVKLAKADAERSALEGLQLTPAVSSHLYTDVDTQHLSAGLTSFGVVADKGVPDRPAVPTIAAITANSVQFEWEPPADNGDPITQHTSPPPTLR